MEGQPLSKERPPKRFPATCRRRRRAPSRCRPTSPMCNVAPARPDRPHRKCFRLRTHCRSRANVSRSKCPGSSIRSAPLEKAASQCRVARSPPLVHLHFEGISAVGSSTLRFFRFATGGRLAQLFAVRLASKMPDREIGWGTKKSRK